MVLLSDVTLIEHQINVSRSRSVTLPPRFRISFRPKNKRKKKKRKNGDRICGYRRRGSRRIRESYVVPIVRRAREKKLIAEVC